MNAVDARSEEIDDLLRGVGDARLGQGLGVVGVTGHHAGELGRQRGAAEGDDALDLPHVEDGKDAGDEGNVDGTPGETVAEAMEALVVEEELGDEEIGSGLDFLLEVVQILLAVGTLDVPFGVGGGGDAEASREGAPDVGDEFRGVGIAFHDIEPFEGTIASKGEDVGDAPIQQGIADGVQLGDVVAHARQVGHGVQAVDAVEPRGDFDRPVPARASGAVGDADVARFQVGYGLDGVVDFLDGDVGLGGKDFEGDDGSGPAEEIDDEQATPLPSLPP